MTRKLILFLLLSASVLLPGIAQASGYTIVQHAWTESASLAYSSSVTPGNLLLVFLWANNTGSTNSISDNVNGAWTKATSENTTDNSAIFFFANTAGGTITVTATMPGSPSFILCIAEVSGVSQTSPLDGAASNTGVGGSPFGSTFATTTDGDFIFGGAYISNGNGHGGSGFTEIDDLSWYDIDEWQTQATHSSSTSVAFTNGISGTGTWEMSGAAFKPPSAVAPCSNFIALMGAGCK